MLKKIAEFFFSTRLTAFLFLVFAGSMAMGTWLDRFAETSPTPYTRELIYNAWWFEAIMLIFVINFVGNMFRYKLYKKKKWATLLLHISFILILIGAFVTRYIGYEGVISIREGATESTLLSDETYLSVFIDGDYLIDGVPQRRRLPPRKIRLSERLTNDFSLASDYNKQPVTIKYVNFIEDAREGIVETEDGDEYLKIVEAEGGSRHDHYIKLGEVANVHNVLFAVNKPTEGAINIKYSADGSHTIESPFEGNFMRMADQFKGGVTIDSVQPLFLRSLYQLADGTISFVIPEPVIKGKLGAVKAPKDQPGNLDALIVEVTSQGESKTLELYGGKGTLPAPVMAEVGGLKVYMTYGSKTYELPFSITLNDFIADKYPGTEKGYSAFKSKVTVNDSEAEFYDYDIYMNHVLDHKGYRFFQSGFDPDEKGTILSVNHDSWGTWITYIGYFMLYFGLLAILFDRNTRFASLKEQLDKVKKKKRKSNIVTILVLFLTISGFAQHNEGSSFTPPSKVQIDSLLMANAVTKEHAAKFSELVIQDNGRMKPVNTFASELLRKVSKKNTYEGLDANQVFLSMTEFPSVWTQVPIIALKRGNDSIREIIGVPVDTKYISLMDLFDEKANYKLQPYLEKATKIANPNQFQKDFIKAHENYYVLNQALSGSILKIFPLPNNENNKWVSYLELNEAGFTGMDSTVTRTILPIYFQTLRESRETGDYSEPEQILDGIAKFQMKYGSEIMPSKNKINAEIISNRVDIFNRLYKYFVVLGAFMFFFIIVQIFNEARIFQGIINVFKYLIWTLFILMTAGLILRWYISGHAPWSDAYESVIYVGWATVFFGLAFGRKSDLTIASTAFVASIILWAAHLNWLDPAIANLQPVLDSYWLMIHVAVIVASYGPFTLGMILGLTSLLLILLTSKKNFNRMDLNIKELTVITEMSLTVGLVMLTIGNFLGGMWANESWGRYWGWDPKETWALISIMIYAFVIHMRLVPGLRGRWFFNVMAVFAYSAIMMTYFGVNFYLSGLHSYASGDAPATPVFVYYIVAGAFVLSLASYFKYRKYYAGN